MTRGPFSCEAMKRALRDPTVASVEVVEAFAASTAEVARLRICFSDGRAPVTAVGKSAAGAGLDDARRELRFYTDLAPLWDHPAPALLGAWEEERSGGRSRILLVTEDLGAGGYASPSEGVSEPRLFALVEVLVALHARFWGDLHVELLDAARPLPSVTRAAQAWPPEVISANTAAVRAQAASFLAATSGELEPAERELLEEVLEGWEARFLARVDGGHSLTLIHGDFHVLGNIFFADGHTRPRVIDWSEVKPGLGPHDLSYCLHSVPAADQPARDHAVLRRYWEGLRAAGVEGYSWDLCQWDYRFSIITNLFQSIFQGSLFWFRKTAARVAELDGLAALHTPPPRFLS